MKISYTLNIISRCWEQAEDELRGEIREYYSGANEEFITQMFHGKFSKFLNLASKDKKIERAFLQDLEIAFPKIQSYELSNISTGLLANVVLHRRKTEAVTGGDIGLVVNRPSVELVQYRNLLKVGFRRNGLLCQAKLRKSNRKWNVFTGSQKKVLVNRLGYLSLLLYEYDDSDRRDLQPFQWQLCNSATDISSVISWLKTGEFPSILNSTELIKGLGEGKIGTDNDQVLDEIIAPKNNSVLEISIGWHNDPEGPGSEVRIYSESVIENKVEQRLYITHK